MKHLICGLVFGALLISGEPARADYGDQLVICDEIASLRELDAEGAFMTRAWLACLRDGSVVSSVETADYYLERATTALESAESDIPSLAELFQMNAYNVLAAGFARRAEDRLSEMPDDRLRAGYAPLIDNLLAQSASLKDVSDLVLGTDRDSVVFAKLDVRRHRGTMETGAAQCMSVIDDFILDERYFTSPGFVDVLENCAHFGVFAYDVGELLADRDTRSAGQAFAEALRRSAQPIICNDMVAALGHAKNGFDDIIYGLIEETPQTRVYSVGDFTMMNMKCRVHETIATGETRLVCPTEFPVAGLGPAMDYAGSINVRVHNCPLPDDISRSDDHRPPDNETFFSMFLRSSAPEGAALDIHRSFDEGGKRFHVRVEAYRNGAAR